MKSEHITPDFLNDSHQYELAESIWHLCWKLAIDQPNEDEMGADPWQIPWLKTCYDDGSPFRDGNPIFSAISLGRQRGIRIIQDETEDLSWRNDVLQDDIKTLTINCSLTERNVLKAFKLIRRWLDLYSRFGRGLDATAR